MKKQTLVFILALLMLASVSCSEQPAVNADESSAPTSEATPAETVETEDTSVKTDLPDDLNFNGAAYRIHNIDCDSYYDTLIAFEQTGDRLNDAIYDRDQALMEKMNFVFEENVYSAAHEAPTVVKNLLAAGDDSYDMYVLVDWSGYTLAQNGYALQISDLPYVDVSREYWAQSIHKDISIKGNLFFAFGDHNLSTYDSTSILLFNKAMSADLNLADHYAAVLEGTWTLDTMHQNMMLATNDADGNGIWDMNDRYGITSHSKQVLPVFWISAGLRTIEKNEEDIPVFTVPSNEKFATLYERILSMMHNDHLLYMSDNFPDYADNTLFKEGGALYNIVRVAFLSYYRDMDIDYGIIPYPKYEETQEQYFSRTEGAYIHVYPVTLKQYELAGAVTEAMACASLNEIIPEYYDVILKSKYVRDENSSAMLDLIYENRIYDLGDTLFCGNIRDGNFQGMMKNNVTSLQSRLKALTKISESVINNYVEAFEEQ